jgi:hypothetical protein
MPQAPTWQRSSTQQQYTLTIGDYQALVWRQTTGGWVAMISRDHTAVQHNFFKNLVEAQGWCEMCLAQLQAKP